jgi:hypothetical protein
MKLDKTKQKAKKLFLQFSEINPHKHKYSYREIARKLSINTQTLINWSKKKDNKGFSWCDIWTAYLKNNNNIDNKNTSNSNNDIKILNNKRENYCENKLQKRLKREKEFFEIENGLMTILKKYGIDILNRIKSNPDKELDISSSEFNNIIKTLNIISHNINLIVDREKDNIIIPPTITIVKRYENITND